MLFGAGLEFCEYPNRACPTLSSLGRNSGDKGRRLAFSGIGTNRRSDRWQSCFVSKSVRRQDGTTQPKGRLHILGKMLETLSASRPELNQFAPRITTIKVRPDQIRIIIGSGGKTIKGITEQTGCMINVEDDGTVAVASADAAAVQRAIEIIKGLVEEPEVGRVYKGTVRRIVDFGAFVEIIPNIEALLHVSEIAHTRTERVEDVFKEGDEIEVKVLSVERDGKIRLSRRALMPLPEGMEAQPEGGGGGGYGGGATAVAAAVIVVAAAVIVAAAAAAAVAAAAVAARAETPFGSVMRSAGGAQLSRPRCVRFRKRSGASRPPALRCGSLGGSRRDRR